MQKPLAKAILFDMDGTLVNTLEDIRSALGSALSLVGLSPPSAETTKSVVGRGLKNALKGALQDAGATLDEDVQEHLYHAMMEFYRTHPSERSTLYEGIGELLEKLHDDGFILGVLSNKEDELTRAIVRDVLGEFHFAWVQGLMDSVPRKPDRTAIVQFLAKQGLSAEEVLYIGDSEVDWQTAANVPCSHILVSWGFRAKEKLQSLPGSVVVDTVHELEDAIYGIQRERSQKQS